MSYLPLPSTPTAESLSAALADFERALDTPLVPGELDSLLQEIRAASQRLGPVLRMAADHEYPKLFEAITEQDIELGPRVARSRDDLAAIVDQHARLDGEIAELADAAEAIEPREEKFAEHLDRLVREGLEWVMAVRRFQVAVDTWHQEAFLRDRGVGD